MPTKKIPNIVEAKKAVLPMIAECDAKTLQIYGIVMPPITVDWFGVKGTVGGKADCLRNKILVNWGLMVRNFQVYCDQTIRHEYAHLLAWKLHGRLMLGDPHGLRWQQVIIRLGGKPNRCHNYDVSEVTNTKKYTCKCPDKTWNLSIQRHNKALRGVKYSCPKCRSVLEQVNFFVRKSSPKV